MIETGALVFAYLVVIVIANLTTATWGATWSIYNAFALVGFSMTTRDRLDDAWQQHRVRNMALLILSGSALSYGASVWLAPGIIPSSVVAKIALASAAAFLTSETLDYVAYHVFHKRPWIERSNLSNLFGATCDSIVFVTIAFGWNWTIIFGQITAKIAGGFIWSMLLKHRLGRLPAEA